MQHCNPVERRERRQRLINTHNILPRDDWRGVTDPAKRRKLQNRCNQRNSRQRRKAVIIDDELAIASTCQPRSNILHDPGSDIEAAQLRARIAAVSEWLMPAAESCGMSTSTELKVKRSFSSIHEARWRNCRLPYHLIEQLVRKRKTNGADFPLSSDHKLFLVYFDVFRGILQNIAILGLDYDRMESNDYPSPFLPLSQSASSSVASLPAGLMPTLSQKTVAHHPEIDIFPDAAFRDNWILQLARAMDDDQFCFDLVGSSNNLHICRDRGPGCYIRGAPWLAKSWEFSEWFVCKYFWMFVGAVSFEIGTNHWRQLRDLEPMCFAAIIDKAMAS